MKSKLIPLLIANLFAAAGVLAADGDEDMKVSGSVTVGDQGASLGTGSESPAKLKEYRDIGGGGIAGRALSGVDIKGRGSEEYFSLYGENLGREDQYIDLKGGRYSQFKFQIYENDIVHNWTFGARTPYAGVGSTTLTATLPNLNTATWNPFDYGLKKQNVGGNFEKKDASPWYFRVDANEVTDSGIKWIGGSNSSSPGGGFNEKPFPVDQKTRNTSAEGGYVTKEAQLSVALLYSNYSNNSDLLRWSNGFFGNQLDTSTLGGDSTYRKISVNGNLKQLPLGSTLAGRVTRSKTVSDIPILGSMPTGATPNPTNDATNPNLSTFDGEVVHKTASLALHSNPTREIDSRIYWNKFEKDNRSTKVTFTPAAGSNLQCGGGPCVTEIMSYKKNNLGADVGFRIGSTNRVVAGLDYVDLERDRVDFDETKDKRASLEWRNTSLDNLSSRFKYQVMQRRSHFLEGNAGAPPPTPDPLYLNRFVARFDASNVDQSLIKLLMDWIPAELWDVGFEGILKQNKYKDTVLGRTKDDRQEFYLSAGYGDIKQSRVFAFADIELVKYDSYHRNISALTDPNAYDPNSPPACVTTNCNYNWAATNKDRSFAYGVGVDWVPAERWKVKGSLISQKTAGNVDFSVQSTPAPITPAVNIVNYDNARKVSLNLKGIYAYTKQIDLIGGYAFEKFRFDDISYNGYQYTIGTGTSTSHLSGLGANPNYTANIGYVAATVKF
jgi:MtrB/PioB family decaheme-associated outer membrane protein